TDGGMPSQNSFAILSSLGGARLQESTPGPPVIICGWARPRRILSDFRIVSTLGLADAAPACGDGRNQVAHLGMFRLDVDGQARLAKGLRRGRTDRPDHRVSPSKSPTIRSIRARYSPSFSRIVARSSWAAA